MRALHVPGPSLSIFSIHDLGFSAFFLYVGGETGANKKGRRERVRGEGRGVKREL